MVGPTSTCLHMFGKTTEVIDNSSWGGETSG